VLEVGRKYRLRNGKIMEVMQKLSINRKTRFSVLEDYFVGIVDKRLEKFHESGSYLRKGVEHEMDAIAAT
jgi:hypothetical protein